MYKFINMIHQKLHQQQKHYRKKAKQQRTNMLIQDV